MREAIGVVEDQRQDLRRLTEVAGLRWAGRQRRAPAFPGRKEMCGKWIAAATAWFSRAAATTSVWIGPELQSVASVLRNGSAT